MVGREIERDILKKMLTTKKAELVVLTGRRRVGKTFLIREAYKKDIVFEFVGTRDGIIDDQLEKFVNAINDYFPKYTKLKNLSQFNSWSNALRNLGLLIDKYISNTKKVVIFFDELPWIASHKSNFLSDFEHWWNSWATKRNIVVVATGSDAFWMINNIIKNKKGLYNRTTRRMHINPFTLYEVRALLKQKRINLSEYELLQLYMVFGGIPHYFDHIDAGKSSEQIIQQMCFASQGFLVEEFDQLYKALFEQPEKYEAIIRVLSKKWKGMTRKEIVDNLKMKDGGTLTNMLKKLEDCSFIMKVNPTGDKTRIVLYRLVDEFTLFYLKFMEGNKLKSTKAWRTISEGKNFPIWQGYAFENLCMRHYEAILMALGISGIHTEFASFNHKGSPTEDGLQIDMIIDRRDNCMNLCEMKFSKDDYIVDKRYADALRKRREVFRRLSKTKKTIFNTFITTYGVVENEHRFAQIDNVITSDLLFKLKRF